MDIGRETDSVCESALHYNRRACDYDKDVIAKGYQGPSVAVRTLAGIFPDDRKEKIILDIGGGTGLVGEELKKGGFEIIDILDSSQKMLDVARQKCIYRNITVSEVRGLNSTPLENDSYDAILGVGVFCTAGPGFMCADIQEMIRVTKPGGVIIMTLRTDTLNSSQYHHLPGFFDQLQSDGVWTQRECSQFNYMHDNVEGQLFVYQKL